MARENISPDAEAIRLALEHVGIAVGSLNPDPTQTIAAHQARQARQDRRSRWSLLIALVAIVVSAASVAAPWVAPRRTPVETSKATTVLPAAGTWVLWIGASLEGGPVVEWTNALTAFDDRTQCGRAWEESMKQGVSTVPRTLQRRGVQWVFSCFPGETHPNGKRS